MKRHALTTEPESKMLSGVPPKSPGERKILKLLREMNELVDNGY